MKAKKLLAIFAAFTMSATVFAVGCEEFNTEGGLMNNRPSHGQNDGNNTDDSDKDDDTHDQGEVDNKPIPEFTIIKQNGAWTLLGTIAVLNDTCLVPGLTGEYQFIIKSDCTAVLTSGFTLDEIFDSESITDPFMMYRVKFDGVYLGGEWHHAGFEYDHIQLAPGSKHTMTLEWQFPFEGSENFTYDDFKGKQLFVNILFWGEENLDVG